MSWFRQGSSSRDGDKIGGFVQDTKYTYNVKLLGILPTSFKKSVDNLGAWHMNNVKVIQKPSETSHEGQVEVMGHSDLICSAIVERKFDMDNILRLDWKEAECDNHEVKGQKDEIKEEVQRIEAIATMGDGEKSPNSKSQDKEEAEEDKEFESRFAVVNFFKNCYNSSWGPEPDFMCERLVAMYLAEDDNPCALIARKVRYTTRDGKNRETIHIKFVPDSLKTSTATGFYFAKWAAEAGIELQKGEEDEEEKRESEEDGEDPKNNHKSVFPHHHAYVQGYLSRNSYSSSDLELHTRSLLSRLNIRGRGRSSFSLGMTAFVGGVWKREENLEDYTCAHLAEMKTAQESTINGDSFYKRVRMRGNWIQCHLAGLKYYMVGINALARHQIPARVIKELRLYDVERIPRAIKIAAEQENFKPWTPDELHEKLFTSLDLIYNIVQSKTGTPEEGQEFLFLRFPRDSKQLVYDPDGELTKHFMKCERQIIVCGLPEKTHLKRKNKEGETLIVGESSSGFQELLHRYWTTNILDIIKYPLNFPYPEVQAPSPCQRLVGRGQCLELTFPVKNLADCVFFKIRESWRKRRDQVPPGFENVKAEIKFPYLPPNHPMAKQNYYGGQGQGRGQDRGDFLNWSNVRRPEYGNARDSRQPSSNSPASASASVYRPPRSRPSAFSSSSAPASDDNWRS